MTSAERKRVDSFGHPEDGLFESTPWYHWGPYLSERAWGTVREDYSADGSAWDYFPHDHCPVPGLPVGRGRHGRGQRRRARSCAWRWRCGTVATRSSRSGCSA